MRIALACSSELKQAGGTGEDRSIAAAIAERGHEAAIEAWDDAGVQWSRLDGALLRSCWDYHLRLEEFRAWLSALATGPVQLWNPPQLVSWNADKRYLLDLADRGLEVVPTQLVEAGDHVRLPDLFSTLAAEALVIKPVVGASAYGTWRATVDAAAAASRRFDRELATGPLLVQPLLREVLEEGEWSLIAIDGKLTHAILKRPGPDDFRVQSELGGTAELQAAPDDLAALTGRALAALDEAPLYARVDVVRVAGRPLLMELELIEPQLFLAESPEALNRLVDALLVRLREHPGAVSVTM